MTRHALVVGAFAASLLAVLVTPLCTRDRLIDTAPWIEAARGERGAVLVHPPWRDDVARALRASGVNATVAFAPRHGDPAPAMVVVTDGAAPLPAALGDRVASRVERGALTIAQVRARGGSDDSGRSLLGGLRDAQVQLRLNDGDTIECPWDPVTERHSCAGQPEWQHVGMSDLPVGGHNVKCAWVHPKTGATLSVRFAHSRVESALELSLALTDGAADNPSGADVTAALLVDGVDVATVTKRAGQRGFAKTAATTTAGEHEVEVRITTPNDGQRHTCMLLDTRGAP